MNNRVCAFLLPFIALGMLAVSRTTLAAEVAITSIGQTSDAMMMTVLTKRMNIDPDYDSVLSAKKLDGQKVIIAVVGGSSKGLGAAGISREEEKNRGRTLLQAANSKGIKVIVMHIGGERRRGELTDSFIETVAGFADRMIVVRSGNLDGIFTRTKPAKTPLTEVDSVQATVPILENTLKAWGVAH